MALTLHYNPGTYFSVHHDLIFTCSDITKASDPITYPDYKYVADVYIGGVIITRLKAYPHPTTKFGVFNISNVVRNYIQTSFSPLANALQAQELGENEFYVEAQVRFGEEYSFTIYPDLIVDPVRTYFNHYSESTISAYVDKVITVRPTATPVYRNARFCFIPFLPSDDTQIDLIIRRYNGSGLISSTTQSFTPPVGSSNILQLFNVAPSAINVAVPGFIHSGVTYYTVEFSTTNIVGDSLLRFNLICEAIHEVFTLHFMNQFGGFESKDFTKVSKKNLEIERSDFGRLPYQIDSQGVPFYYNSNQVYNEQKSTYAVQWEEKMTLNSDILTDAEYVWLRDLILSPLIYLEQSGFFIPVNITEKNYEPKKSVNDDLTNLTLNIEFGKQFNAQYR